MSPEETLECLMCEAGPLLGLEQIVAHSDRQAWQLRFDADTVLDAAYDSGLNRLVISGRIATVPDASRLSTYEILLRYNAAWMETGGARMALEGDGECILILFDLPCAQLHASLLTQVLENMAGIQRAWRQILQEPQLTTSTKV